MTLFLSFNNIARPPPIVNQVHFILQTLGLIIACDDIQLFKSSEVVIMRQQRNGIMAALAVGMLGHVLVASEKNDDHYSRKPKKGIHPFFDATTLTPEEVCSSVTFVIEEL